MYATQGNPEAIKNILKDDNVISDSLATELQQAYGVGSKDEVVEKVAENAIELYDRTKEAAAKGPERALMPQTGGTDGFGKTKPEDKIAAMKAGAVNWNTKGDGE